jgi:arginine decarboxylase-like protein
MISVMAQFLHIAIRKVPDGWLTPQLFPVMPMSVHKLK